MPFYGKVINDTIDDYIPSMNRESNSDYEIIFSIIPEETKFTKVHKDIYATMIKSMLAKDNRYVIIVIEDDDNIPIGQLNELKNIKWKAVQFRTMEGYIDNCVSKQDLTINIDRSIPIQRYEIWVDDDGKKMSDYKCNLYGHTFKITLIHNTDSDYEFGSQGTLMSALITWNTILTRLSTLETYDINHKMSGSQLVT